MELYKPSVVSNVESAIVAMNKVVSLLHCDSPLASQIIEVNYRAEVVEEFTQSSHEVLSVSSSYSPIYHDTPSKSIS